MPDAEELYTRSRGLYIDLLKLGLSLSTGVVAALSLIVLSDKKPVFSFNKYQATLYKTCLIFLLFSIGFAITGWLAQAAFYSAWAFYHPDNENKRDKWKILRNISLVGFVMLFASGIVVAAILINTFVKVTD